MSIVVRWFQRTLKQLEREQTDTHTHRETHATTTVNLAHARRGLTSPSSLLVYWQATLIQIGVFVTGYEFVYLRFRETPGFMQLCVCSTRIIIGKLCRVLTSKMCRVPVHCFRVVQPPRTSSNLLEPLQCRESKVCRSL